MSIGLHNSKHLSFHSSVVGILSGLTSTCYLFQDSTFSWDDFLLKNNSELLNNLGNFINR